MTAEAPEIGELPGARQRLGAGPSVAARARRWLPRAGRRRWWIGGGVLVLGLASMAVLGAVRPEGLFKRLFGGPAEDATVYDVKPVNLNITLKEDGELKPVNSLDIKNEVQAQNLKIEWVVDESTRVKKGDRLLKLSSDEMREKVEMEEIELGKLRAGAQEAEEALKITISENESKLKKVETDLEVALVDLEKYMQGDYEKARKLIEISIKQTEMDIKRRQEELRKSRPLQEKGFITATRIQELEDELEKARLTQRKNELELSILEQYDLKKSKMEKEQAVTQAREELDRERQRAESRKKQAEAKLEDQRKLLAIREKRFARSQEQLAKCEIFSPADGIVRYGDSGERRFWGGNRIAPGEQVYPGQTLLSIPDTSKMMVTTRVHEADRHRISDGLLCTIKVPAVPDRTFSGKLTKIAQFADSERSWLNPNLKEHTAEVLLDDSDAPLSPGDTAHVEMHIEEVRDVLAVPVQCVFARGNRHFVFVQGAMATRPIEIKLGRSTDTMVEVTSGVAAGDDVLMAAEERLLAMLPAADAPAPAGQTPAPAKPAPAPGGSVVAAAPASSPALATQMAAAPASAPANGEPTAVAAAPEPAEAETEQPKAAENSTAAEPAGKAGAVAAEPAETPAKSENTKPAGTQ